MKQLEYAIIILISALVGIVDFLTGFELSFGVFYLIPISWAALRFGLLHGLIISMMSGLAWAAADSLHPYQNIHIYEFNLLTRIVLFLGISYIMHNLSDSIRIKKKQNKNLIQLNEERNKFLGMAAHDLRNPLTTINLSSDYLLSTDLNEHQATFVKKIKLSSGYMVSMINDFLDISRMQEGNIRFFMRSQDYTKFLKDTIEENKPYALQKNISFSVDIAQGLYVNFDKDKLRQVCNNLLWNAIKHSPETRKITIKAYSNNSIVYTKVTDSGPGILEEDKFIIFQAFRQGKNAKSGSGLGLAISKFIIEKHKGKIWVDSEPGHGASFTFTLPVDHNLL